MRIRSTQVVMDCTLPSNTTSAAAFFEQEMRMLQVLNSRLLHGLRGMEHRFEAITLAITYLQHIA